ncbi:HNH endonuclease [Halococcus sediminicola]|uniref:HNH endonuclease n=1 Tax=Halococcus sediminicola TaxID=1264579 RepID=UPI001F2C1127|nr:HNH endonuclease signature motif containing protein [Halococcus sediminicola]
MTIEDIGQQQLRTHSVLGWNPSQLDMPKQRANWLRSFGLVQRDDDNYTLTDEGWQFTESAIEQWSNDSTVATEDESPIAASTYETTVQARSVDPEFRATILERYGATCPVSGVDYPALLDVAHVLSWSEYPDCRADPTNVLPLSKTHHAAFDRELFTIDQDYRLQVNPEFDTESEILRTTIVDNDGAPVPFRNQKPDAEYLNRHNETLDWVTT